MAKEVARYNAMQQNAQTLNVNLNNTVLFKAKPEILRAVELLIDKMQGEMSELLVEVCCVRASLSLGVVFFAENRILLSQLMDIILHCVDPGHLKAKGLLDVFPAVCRFNQVSHCPATRRIAGEFSAGSQIFAVLGRPCWVSFSTFSGSTNSLVTLSNPYDFVRSSYKKNLRKSGFYLLNIKNRDSGMVAMDSAPKTAMKMICSMSI